MHSTKSQNYPSPTDSFTLITVLKPNEHLFFYRLGSEEMLSQQQEWQNELEIKIEHHQRRDDTFEARIVLLEENQETLNESVAEQQDRIRNLSEIQNKIKARYELESEQPSTPLAIRNTSSKMSTF